MGQDGFGVGADLVGHFAGAAKGAVAANDDQVDLAALHQMAGGVVGDDLMRNASAGRVPRQSASRPGSAAGFRRNKRGIFLPWAWAAYSGAVALPTSTNASQPALQWVRMFMPLRISFAPCRPMSWQWRTSSLANSSAAASASACCSSTVCAGAHGGADLVHRVDRVNGRGPRGFEGLVDGFDVPAELRRLRPRKARAPWARP